MKQLETELTIFSRRIISFLPIPFDTLHFPDTSISKPEGNPECIRKFHLEIDAQREPRYVLLTGGASCPDGIIQQVIKRINGFSLRTPCGLRRS